MPKVKLTEKELRKVLEEVLLEVAPNAEKSLTPNSYIKDVVASTTSFSPAKRLELIKKLTGIDGNNWWESVKSSCTVSHAQNVKSGATVWSDASNTTYSSNPASFLDNFLNFCILGLMSLKTVTIGSARAPNGDSRLSLTPNAVFDVVISDDGVTAYVQSDALKNDCKSYFGIDNVILFEQSGVDLLRDAAIDKLINAERGGGPVTNEGTQPKNLCYSYIPQSKKENIKKDLEAGFKKHQSNIQGVLDDTSREVYETYLYMPLLNPRIWLQPDHPPDSPLFTPWRMTWSACYLLSDILTQYGEDGKFAILTQLYRIMRRGTSINVTDAPGADYALGGGISLEEARFMVGNIMMTEMDLRRVISASLIAKMTDKSVINEMKIPGLGSAVDVGADIARGTGRVVAAGASRVAAAAESEGQALKAAGGSISTFAESLRAGTIVAVSKFNIPEMFASGLPNLQFRLGQTIAKNFPETGLPLPEADLINTVVSSRKAALSPSAPTHLQTCYEQLAVIAAKRAKGQDTAAEDAAFKVAADKLTPQDRALVATSLNNQKLSSSSNARNAAVTTVRDAAIPEMKSQNADWLTGQMETVAPGFGLKAEVDAAGNIQVTMNKPKVTYDPSAKTVNMTFERGERINFDNLDAELRRQSSALRSSGASAADIQRATFVGVDLPDDVRSAIVSAKKSLSASETNLPIIRSVTDTLYDAVDAALPIAVPNKTTDGLFTTTGTSRVAEKVATFVDYLTATNPSKGLVPFLDTPLTDIKGKKIAAGSLSRMAWEDLKPNLSSTPTNWEIAKAGAQQVLRFITTFGAAGYELSTSVLKAKALAGQYAVKAIATAATKADATLIKGAGAKVSRAIENEMFGHYIGLGAFAGTSLLLGTGITAKTKETTDKEVQEAGWYRLLKTLYVDLNTSPITFNNKGVTFVAGGIPRVVIDLALSAYSETVSTDVKDYDSMTSALKAAAGEGEGDATAAVEDMLVSAFRNMYKNGILDADPTSQIFPGLQKSFADIFPEITALAEAAKQTAAVTLEGTATTIEALNRGKNPQAAVAAGAATKQTADAAAANLRATIEQYKSAITTSEDTSELEADLNSARLSLVEDAVAALQGGDPSQGGVQLRDAALQIKPIMVTEDYGRADAQEAETSETLDVAAKILYDSSSYFEFATNYLEYIDGPQGVAIAASRGKYGQEFLGELNKSEAKAAFKSLSDAWEESNAAMAEALRSVVRQ